MEKPSAGKKAIIPLITVGFLAMVMILVMNGGMCERYERKMQRREMMRHYIDSIRTEQQLKKLQPEQP